MKNLIFILIVLLVTLTGCGRNEEEQEIFRDYEIQQESILNDIPQQVLTWEDIIHMQEITWSDVVQMFGQLQEITSYTLQEISSIHD